MKMLIYGIDGGDLEIMKTFDMPFVHQFLKDNVNVDLTVDLYNRGWVEILTGKEGKDTRGFYMAPVLDGSHRCATKFSMKELENDPDVIPLWKLAEQKGVKYCIMNVPTTTPVPKTKNGIVVGSGGGGLNKISGIPEILVSDQKTRKFLEERNYIVDIRIPNEDIEDTEELFRKLIKMEDIRTDCFVELCKEEEIEFGFLANRGTTIAQYLARSEIESYASLKEMGEFIPTMGEKSWVQTHLEEHFSALDNNIRDLYEELKPDHFIITADHNIVPHKHRGNVNVFLQQQGFLRKKSSSPFLKGLKKFVRKFIKGESIGKVTSKLNPTVRESLKLYDWKHSYAFGHDFVSGVFINDSERFDGPVKDEQEIDKMVSLICEKLNADKQMVELEVRAVPYRKRLKTAKYEKYLPDIIFEGSEGIFFDDGGSTLFRRNKNYGSVPRELGLVTHAAHSGDKGVNPICLMDSALAGLVSEFDAKNLTLVYNLTERVLDNV